MDVARIGTRDEAVNASASSSSNSPFLHTKKAVTKETGERVFDRISINLNDAEGILPQSAVQDAREGDKNKYRFTDVSDNGIASNGLLDCITQEDVKDMEEEGMSLEKYESEQLERAVERIKSQRAMNKESVERYTERKKAELNDIKKASLRNHLPNDVPDYMLERMVAEDVPITEENVKRATKAYTLANNVTDLTDGSIRFLLQNELEPTVRNLYHAKFSGIQTVDDTQGESTSWNEVKNQAEKILNEAGYEWNEESQSQAKWLFLNGLPVTGDVMRSYNVYLSIRERNDEKKNMECIVKAMAKGIDPERASLNAEESSMAELVVQDFQEVNEESMRYVYLNKQEMNLKNLREAKRHVSFELNVKKDLVNSTDEPKKPQDVEFITEKRRMEEIRLKMTVQSAGTLLKKGIVIDTAPLKELVEELRELENQQYQNLFAEVGTQGESAEVDLLKETTETVRSLYTAPAYILGVRFQNGGERTIRNLAEDAAVLRGKLDAAGEAYEKLMTAPRKDMGDSILKAFQNVDDILEDYGYELNESNRRAVRILGYNRIEINEESIERMKDADIKVNYTLKNLHPAVTVQLIKQNVNPLDMPIHELNEVIRNQRSELGVTEDERFSKYLWQLEKSEGITPEERDSYIGVYRMLHQIQNMDGAAVGALVEAGGELTLNHLMTAVRTLKSGGVKAKVDDGFGAATSITRKAKTITEQAAAAFHTQTYHQDLAEDALDQMSPEKWKMLWDENKGNVWELSLETFRERLNQTEESLEGQDEYYQEMAERARDLLNVNNEEVGFLESYHIPVTMYHVEAVRQMASEGQSTIKRMLEKKEDWEEEDYLRLEDAANGLLESLEDREALKEQDAKVRDAVIKILNRQKSNVMTFEDMRRIRMLEGGIRLRSQLSERESYEIPYITEEGVTNVNLTVIRGGGEKGKLHMDIHSPVLGAITSDFTIKGNRVKGTVFCEDVTTSVKVKESGMMERMQNDGYEVLALHVGRVGLEYVPYKAGEGKEENDQSDTKSIYRLAKNIIKSVQLLENHDRKEEAL